MNRHVGNERMGHEKVYRGHGFRIKNEVGEKVLNFAVAYDLPIMNTFFKLT